MRQVKHWGGRVKTKMGGTQKRRYVRALTGHSGWDSTSLKAALHSAGRPLEGAIWRYTHPRSKKQEKKKSPPPLSLCVPLIKHAKGVEWNLMVRMRLPHRCWGATSWWGSGRPVGSMGSLWGTWSEPGTQQQLITSLQHTHFTERLDRHIYDFFLMKFYNHAQCLYVLKPLQWTIEVVFLP